MVENVIEIQNQTDASQAQTLPRNLEAEQNVLGAILLNNKAGEQVSEFLKAEHFAHPSHADIYTACMTLINRGHLADYITLGDYLEQTGALDGLESVVTINGREEKITGRAILNELMRTSGTIVNVEDYARLIRDRYLKRSLIATGQRMISDAFSSRLDETGLDQVEKASGELYNLATEGDAENRIKSFDEASKLALKNIEEAYKNEGQVSGLSTGMVNLDKRLGGLNPSDLIILAGRPAMGKTTLALNIASNVARNFAKKEVENEPVLVFSLEMSADQLASRVLASITEVNISDARKGNMTEEQFMYLASGVQTLASLPLHIDDTPGLTVPNIRTRARRFKQTRGLSLIIIDYIQLLSTPGGPSNNRVQEVSEMSRGLKLLAKELEVPVIALSQLNRGVEQRDDKRPKLSDLRESGSIEQDADIVMFVFREEYYHGDMVPPQREGEPNDKYQERCTQWEEKRDFLRNKAEAIVAKHRHGSPGTEMLYFEGDISKFDALAPDDMIPDMP